MHDSITRQVWQRTNRLSHPPKTRSRKSVALRPFGKLLGQVAQGGTDNARVDAERDQCFLSQSRWLCGRLGISDTSLASGDRDHVPFLGRTVATPAHTEAACRCASRSAREPACVTWKWRRDRPPRTG